MLFGCPLEFEVFPILAFSAPGPPLPDLEEIDAGGPWVVGEWDSSDNRFTGSFTWLNCIQPVGFLNLLTFFGMFSLLHRFFLYTDQGVSKQDLKPCEPCLPWSMAWYLGPQPRHGQLEIITFPGCCYWFYSSTLIILVELLGEIRIIIVHIPVFVV